MTTCRRRGLHALCKGNGRRGMQSNNWLKVIDVSILDATYPVLFVRRPVGRGCMVAVHELKRNFKQSASLDHSRGKI
jgi:hypothetical protein